MFKIAKDKRKWLIVLLCLTLIGVGAGFTVGDSFAVSSPAAGEEKGVYVMDVEYLGPDADYIEVKSKNEVVAEFYDVEDGDILHIDATGLDKGKLEADTRFYIDRASGGGTVEVKIHTSCSKPLAVGMIFDDDHPWLEVVYLDATGGECEPGCPDCHKPDLVISSKWEEWVCNTQYKVHFVVRNQGDETVPAGHDVSLFIDGSKQSQHVTVPVSLAPGETWEGSFSNIIIISGSSDTVKVCADDNDEVDESNESNNCLHNTVTKEDCPDCPECNPCVEPLDCCTEQIAKIWQRISQLECSILEIQHQQAELEIAIQNVRLETEMKVKLLQSQMEAVQDEADVKLNVLQNEIDSLSTEMTQKLRMLEIKMDYVETQLEKDLNKLDDQIESVEQRTEWRIDGMEKQYTSLDREMDRLLIKVDYVEREIYSLDKRIDNVEQETRKLWTKISELERRLNALEAKVNSL